MNWLKYIGTPKHDNRVTYTLDGEPLPPPEIHEWKANYKDMGNVDAYWRVCYGSFLRDESYNSIFTRPYIG